jgi:hypothetical protein
MAIKVDVRGSMARIIADMERVKRDVAEVAVVRTLNKVAAQVKTAAAREMRSAGYNLKVSDIKKSLTTIQATSGSLTARVVASGRPVPLIKYGARMTSRGVSVDVLHGRKLIAGAFIATMPSGHTGVYVRVGNERKKVSKNGRATWSNLPIKELFGPSVPNGLINKAVQEALQHLIEEKFPIVFAQQMKYMSR